MIIMFVICILQDSLKQRMAQGGFTPIGRHDILATATGKPKHPAHVKGVSHGVEIKDYFGGSS